MTKFNCNLCNKTYSYRQSLYLHKKNKHNGEETNDNICNIYNTKQNCSIELSKTVASTKPKTKHSKKEQPLFKCNNCSRKYKHYQSKYRHQRTCVSKDNEMISKDIMEAEIDKLKDNILELINKNFKMHHMTFKKLKNELKSMKTTSSSVINNTSRDTYNTQNNTVIFNGTVNINNIIPLGQEDFRYVLTKEQQIAIVNKGQDCIKYFLNITHFNPDTPQYQSFIITNTQNNIAYIYDEESKDYVAITKDELLNNIFDERCDDIRNFAEYHEDNIHKGIVKRVHRFINKLETETQFNKKIGGELKVYIYDKTKHIDINKMKMLKN
jgi:hypothetical protein